MFWRKVQTICKPRDSAENDSVETLVEIKLSYVCTLLLGTHAYSADKLVGVPLYKAPTVRQKLVLHVLRDGILVVSQIHLRARAQEREWHQDQ